MSNLCNDTESEKKNPGSAPKVYEVYFGPRHILHPSSVEISSEKILLKKQPHKRAKHKLLGGSDK